MGLNELTLVINLPNNEMSSEEKELIGQIMKGDYEPFIVMGSKYTWESADIKRTDGDHNLEYIIKAKRLCQLHLP